MYYEETGMVPMGPLARMLLSLFGVTLRKMWLVHGIVLLSGIEDQEFNFSPM
jgi:hypothetical protein